MTQTKQLTWTPNNPAIMGIVNLTPDSFSDGGHYQTYDVAMTRIEHLINAGATVIDIGAESTRPGSDDIDVSTELKRLENVLKNFKKQFDVVLSLDTKKPTVASFGLDLGVDIINDVSGGTNPDMRAVVARYQAPIIVMHMQHNPKVMQNNPSYSDVVADVKTFFEQQIDILTRDGIESILLDPGIGFGKTLQHNIALLQHLETFQSLQKPIVIGTSKKSFISKITQEEGTDRLEGTVISNFIALQKGASMIRVHDVVAAKKVVQLYQAFKETI